MRWQGIAGQQKRDLTYDASGTITAGGTAQLLLPEAKSRGYLLVQNISAYPMNLEMGSARATCTINSSGQVSTITVTNAGFNFTYPPDVVFIGGGGFGQSGMYGTNLNFVGIGGVGYPAPSAPAKAHCVMGTSGIAGLTVSSIVIDNPGSGYLSAPFVFIHNSLRDPAGVATPSATSGILLTANGGSIIFDGSSCPTDQLALYCGTTSAAFACKYME